MILALFAFLLLQSADPLVIEGSPAVRSYLEAGVLEDELLGAEFHDDLQDFEIGDLCEADGPDLFGTSQRLTDPEVLACLNQAHNAFREVPLGLTALVLASAEGDAPLNMDLRELYLASAFLVPANDKCKLVRNPHKTWQDINPALPDRPIRIYGPRARSGAQSIFFDRALLEGARRIDCLEELERRDPEAFARAIMTREDEAWLESSDNDESLIAALHENTGAIGIFGWDSFSQTQGLAALSLSGIVPNEVTFSDGTYPLVSPLYLYASPQALQLPSVRRLLSRLEVSEAAAQVRRYTTEGAAVSTVEALPSGARVRRYATQR